MKKKAELLTQGVCLRVHFDLWRKRMYDRKKRVLEELAREVGNN